MTPGSYKLYVDFQTLNSQRALLKQLEEPLTVRNKFLLRGIIKLLNDIEWQEANTDTSCHQDKVVTLEIERASQQAPAAGSS
jgi:hypothetical protein